MAGCQNDLCLTNQKRWPSVFWFFCAAILYCCTATSYAQTNDKKIVDVRVVIDVSGSMKQNDPNNLRQPALELLVKLLPQESKAGVWTFGKYINMLVPHSDVNEDWRQEALSKGSEINSTGLFTNIGEALEKAAYDAKYPNDKYRTSIILLTDGMVDIDREPEVNQKEWRRLVDDVLPSIKNAGYTIHTIALSDNADSELMNKLAVSTDGVAAVAKTADELMKIFLAAFDNAAPAEQVPLKDNTFVVDSSVEEFTALIFTRDGSAPTKLLSPEGKEYSFAEEDPYINWYRSDKYDLITVAKPIEGEWQALADLDPDSRITVVSNLNLVVKSLKNNIANGEEQVLSLLLSEGGKTITRTNFLEVLDIHYTVERLDDGKQWQSSLTDGGVPGNGVYTATLDMFSEQGDYLVSAVVDGKSFTREFTHTISVRQPFTVNSEKELVNGKNHYRIQVSYYGDDLDRQATKVAATVRDPKRKTTIQTFTLTESDNWTFDLDPDEEGLYEFAVTANAVRANGSRFTASPKPIVINTESDDPFSYVPPIPEPQIQPPPVIEPEPSPEPEVEIEPQIAAPEPVLEPIHAEPVAAAESNDSKLFLYIGLAVGNVVILLLAYMAYRMIMGNKKDPEIDQLEQAVSELDSADSEPEPKPTAPSMADMSMPEDEKIPAMEPMPEDLNIASDEEPEVKKADGDAPAMHQADAEEDAGDGDFGASDVEFSLDDFSSDDLDDDDD